MDKRSLWYNAIGEYRREGERLGAGDLIKLPVKRAYRLAVVRAVDLEHKRALVEYEMPEGKVYLTEIRISDWGQRVKVQRSKLPERWRRLWPGYTQSSQRVAADNGECSDGTAGPEAEPD